MNKSSIQIAQAIKAGKKFGERVVLEEVDPVAYDVPGLSPNVHRRVKVRCSCGLVSDVFWSPLKHGRADRCPSCAMHLVRTTR